MDYVAALVDESIKHNALTESERMVSRKRVNTLYSRTIHTFFQISLSERAPRKEADSATCCPQGC